MKVKLRALRGLKNTQVYGRVSGGTVFEADPHLAKQLVAQGSAEYVDGPLETTLPVNIPSAPDPLPDWPLQTPPEDYIKRWGGIENPSSGVKENLDLAYGIVGA